MSIINWLFEKNEHLIEALCERVSQNLPYQRIDTEGSPYLERFYIFRRSWLIDTDDEKGVDDLSKQTWWQKRMKGIYLHHFHRGDHDRELHNHPWDDSWSLILTNGYFEERGVGSKILNFVLKPGSINRIKANDFHRVDLRNPNKGCWTLFFSGPRVQNWGFKDWLNPDAPFVPYQEHTASDTYHVG